MTGETAPAAAFRILHLSDLHFGRNFRASNWRQLKERAIALQPDLIIVTGDLVNTPWFWKLKDARAALDELAAALPRDAQGETCEVWAIPGNHDTRFTGLIPVRWLLAIAATGALLSAAFIGLHLMRPAPALFSWIGLALAVPPGLVALIALALRCVVRIDLGRAIGSEHMLDSARLAKRGGHRVGIVPFDSASPDVSMARGRVSDDAFAAFRDGMAAARKQANLDDGARPLWIAAVHHHPLPLPYDSDYERMMVMDNAGALISELSKAGIGLALHGHKHHQHFARILIDPVKAPSSELAVLSAGTPTERRDPGAWRHGFNVIEVDPDGLIRIAMYEGPPGGGVFEPERTFDLAPIEDQERRRHLDDEAKFGLRCEQLLCVGEIDAYGGARFVREFRGFSTRRPALKTLPAPWTAMVSRGFVEAVVAQLRSDRGPSVTVQVERLAKAGEPEKAEINVGFSGAGLLNEDAPIDFLTEFHASNAFAFDRWQFKCMYPAATEPRESIKFRAPAGVATQELLIHVSFPEDAPLPSRLELRRHPAAGDARPQALPREQLVRIESQSVVQARIRYPRPGAVYEINWELPQDRSSRDDSAPDQWIARSLALRKGLAQLTHADTSVKTELGGVIERARLMAAAMLGSEPKHDSRPVTSPYQIALFVFDDKTNELRYLAGNYAKDDPRIRGRYPFGLGIPGRAFKSGKTVAFRRPHHALDERSWGYLMPDGSRVADITTVPEDAILALAVAPVDAPGWPYAVIQLSSDSPRLPLKTVNTPIDTSVEQYNGLLRRLTETFEAILDPSSTSSA